MKKILRLIFIIALLVVGQSVFAQRSPEQDSLRKYFSKLVASKEEADKALLREKLYGLLQSDREQDWIMAASFFYQIKRSVRDSIWKVLPLRFPKGLTARDAATDTIYKVKDAAEKEALYKAWVKKFPPKDFPKDRIGYDYVRGALANAYAKEGNIKKTFEYANMIETSPWKGEGWAGPAMALKENGHLNEAMTLLKKARDTAYAFMTNRRNEYGAGFAAMGFPGYSNGIAEILMKQKKYAEALPYIREAHDSAKQVKGYVNTTYATVLMELGKNNEAFEIINETVKAGQGTAEIKKLLKTLYPKVKGSLEGYDEYMANLDKQLAEKVRQDLAKQMINLPAANFTLKDVDGKTVSLADYKGKIVVLDFWATWCGPCKKSFPAMKQAMAKFKDDPNVKFLFIHTMEQQGIPQATAAAKKYVTDNNYPFEVLMDTVDPETGLNNVAKNYKVEGIPTKFVVDKNGNIRFRLLGFSSTDEAAVEEVAAMIEMASKN